MTDTADWSAGKGIADPGFFPIWRQGSTPFYTCAEARGLSYCAYIPVHRPARRWLVAVHGSDRGAESLRDAFVSHAEATGTAIFAPLFPIGLSGPDDEPGYKFIAWEGRRHDLEMNALLEDAARRFDLPADRVQMLGFSGGAQFVQRYLLLHPHRVVGASIGAPGYVTLLDDDLDWWPGVRDFEATFGQPLDRDRLREVPVQLVVGRGDLDEKFMRIPRHSPIWAPGADRAGRTRVERAQRLAENLRRNGIAVDLVLAEETRHRLSAAIRAPMEAFLGRHATAGPRG